MKTLFITLSLMSIFFNGYSQNGIIRTETGLANEFHYKDGAVGIGGLPSYPLHVNKFQDGLTFINISNSSEVTGSGSGIRFYTRQDNGGGSWWSNIAIKGDRMLHFNMEQKEDAMIINQAGQIGIGTTTPNSKLTINDGALSFTGSVSLPIASIGLHSSNFMYMIGGTAGLKLTDDSSNGITILDGGNIGIGIDDPSSRFQVRASHTYGESGVYAQFQCAGGARGLSLGQVWNGSQSYSSIQSFYNGTTPHSLLLNPSGGSVGIGTTTTGTHKLAVEGTIGAREIKVEATAWSDFVFNKDYKLKDLEEVESFIEENNHLPDVPSEKEVLENGIALGEMDATLLQKIEELTLYMIDQNKMTNKLIEEVQGLKVENKTLKKEINTLKAQ